MSKLRTPLAVALEVMVLDKGCADCEHRAVAIIRAYGTALLDALDARATHDEKTAGLGWRNVLRDLRREVEEG